ncbi:hypothetical protein [Carnobacterium maltaromaticum]|uniref:hypothetical protein n=1 Tax=Carnobacterium maltaromaticum TaxID=2751 RepID=UPI000C77746F|nr:hypothetical protein [Carnobacterium maltaromaticum]PLS40730.1 hypothetical protein CYV32_16075 [Carnobacterium maltaromaticum]
MYTIGSVPVYVGSVPVFLLDRVTTLPKDYRNITKTLPDKLIKKPNVTKTLPQPYQKITKTLPSNTYPQITQTPPQRSLLLFIELKN